MRPTPMHVCSIWFTHTRYVVHAQVVSENPRLNTKPPAMNDNCKDDINFDFASTGILLGPGDI